MNVATCSLISDLLLRETPVTEDVLRQLECYLSVTEIARSKTHTSTTLTADSSMSTCCDVLQRLLYQLERQDSPQLPGEIVTRLLSLIASVICLADSQIAAIPEIQLQLLRYMDSCRSLPADFAVDLALLQFQSTFLWDSRPG